MIPLLIPGVISLASSAMDAWHKATSAKTAAPQGQPKVTFDNLLKMAATATAPKVVLSQSQVNTMAGQFLQSPEMQAALNGSGVSQAVGVSIAGNGSVSVTTPGGGSRNLVLSPQTQALAVQLGQALGTQNQQKLVLQTGAGASGAIAGNAQEVIFQGV
jgi:hypothetical protein